MKIESKKIPQKQEVQGGKIFSKEAYSDVSNWEINFSNDEIRSFSGFFIDIFADIIDNYGDMWWVLEFLMMSRLPVSFRIVTDDTDAMRKFLERSECTLPQYELLTKKMGTSIEREEEEKKAVKTKSNKKEEKSIIEDALKSPIVKTVGRTIARELTRGLLGVLGFGGNNRRR